MGRDHVLRRTPLGLWMVIVRLLRSAAGRVGFRRVVLLRPVVCSAAGVSVPRWGQDSGGGRNCRALLLLRSCTVVCERPVLDASWCQTKQIELDMAL